MSEEQDENLNEENNEELVEEVNLEDLGKAVGRIPSGVGILITLDENDDEQTMLCSWFQQISFDPLLIGVAIQKNREIGDCLQDTGLFVLNILAEGDKKNMAHFAKGFKEEEDPFEGIEILEGRSGLPYLKDSLAFLECELQQVFEIGDHRLYVGEVVGGKVNTEGNPRIHLRRSGFNY